MDLFRRLFQKFAPRGLFTFAFPQAPASLQNPDYLKGYRGWVYACVKRKADSIATMELTFQRRQGDEWKEVSTGPALKALDLLHLRSADKADTKFSQPVTTPPQDNWNLSDWRA